MEHPVPRHGDERLVAVLLEEHPLQRLGAVVGVFWHVLRPLAEVPEDCAGLPERAPVVEDDRRHAQSGVEPAEHLFAVRLVDH